MRIALLAGILSLGVGAVSFAQTREPDPYVGNEMCVRCHASDERSLQGSPHDAFDETSDQGCQTCHGPGRAHVRNPLDPEHQPRVEGRREACLECHEDSGHDLEHFRAGQTCSSCHAIHDFDAGVTAAAGDARCVSCHEGEARKWRSHATPHSAESCASCHTLGNLAAQTWAGRAGTERCQSCHAQSHPRFFASSHARAGLSCKSCHTVHAGDLVDELAPDSTIGRASQKCTECHATAVTEFSFNERHRLEEGVMECTSCHNPHEPTKRFRLGGFKNQQCTQCHVDKMGPFVFEHGTSFVEGCTSCHVAHGSPNRHMLEFQSVADQCYSCHVVAPGFHARFTSQTLCTNCHSRIHGSNLHPAFLK